MKNDHLYTASKRAVYTSIPSDEVTALYETHVHHGRKAKALIRQAWQTGNYAELAPSIDHSALQRFRNSAHGGPAGLQKISFEKLARDLSL